MELFGDEVTEDVNENNEVCNYRINNNKTTTSKYFEYRTEIIGSTRANDDTLDTEVVVSLKYLGHFWRSPYLPLVNCEIELHLLWLNDCIISEVSRTSEVPANSAMNPPTDPVLPTQTTEATLCQTFCPCSHFIYK